MSFRSKTSWVYKIHIVVLLYSSRPYSTAEPLKKKKRKKVQLKMWVWLNSENKMHIVGSMWVWVDWKNKIHIVYSNNLERKFWLGWFFLHEENNRIRLIIYEKSLNYS